MPKEPTTANASWAFVKALTALDNVKANKINPAFKAKYVSLDALLDAVKPVLGEHDVALVQVVYSEEGKVGVMSYLLHGPTGETLPKEPKIVFLAATGNEQQISSRITYLRRMTSATLCGISVDTDDDGNNAVRYPTPSRPWTTIIPADLTDKAKAYVIGKGWLKDGQQLIDLPQEHVTTILGNQTAFLNVIRR